MVEAWMRRFFAEDEPVVESQFRAGWLAFALILQTDINISYLMPLGSLIPLALLSGSFLAMWLALGPNSLRQFMRPLQRFLGLMQFLILFFTLIVAMIGSAVFLESIRMCFLAPQFFDDSTSLNTNAAILLLQGHNPYTDSNILDVARRFQLQPTWTTPLRRGQFADRLDYPTETELQTVFAVDQKTGQAAEFESKVSYPALSFLVLVPFALVNNYNVLPFALLSYLLLIAVAWKASSTGLRPWILLVSLANVPVWILIIGASTDTFYALLIVLAWLVRGCRWNSAIFLGLALASKQLAWFFVPFYLVMVMRHYGLREAIYRLIVVGSIGLAINLPFIVWDAQAWVTGILAPVADPTFPLGVGLIELSIAHILPFFPNWTYNTLEGCAMLLSLAWYWCNCRKRPEAAMFLAVLPLFFAWRSLLSYFSFAAYQLFVLIAAKAPPGSHGVISSRGEGLERTRK